MVQRKAPDKPKSSADKLESQFSSHLQHDTRSMAGADLKKKKINKVRSMKVSDFDSLQFKKAAPCKRASSIPIRNYMKPTSSSESRKGNLQATVTSPAINDNKRSPKCAKNSSFSKASSCSPAISASARAVMALSRQSSLKPVRPSMKKSLAVGAKKNVNRATCSSTLKDSMFPAALELSCGATEAEGTSKMRVCPYTYCSLNGHMHEPLPPLKHFISARRKLLKANTGMKIKELFSFEASQLGMEAEKIHGKFVGDAGKAVSDLFVEIYAKKEEENIGNEVSIQEERDQGQSMLDEVEDESGTMRQMNESSEISFEYDYDMDQSSEFSHDGMDDAMMTFLEYVEFDHERKAQQDYDFQEDGEVKKSDNEAVDMDWKEEIGLFADNSESSECPDDQLSVNTSNVYVRSDAEDDSESKEENSHMTEKEDSLISGSSDISKSKFQIMDDDVLKHTHEENETIVSVTREHRDGFGDINSTPEKKKCQSDECNLADIECNNLEEEQQKSLNETAGNILKVSAIDCREIDEFNKLSARWNITRKTATKELEQVKEFNPRAPQFLPLEPDPEAEKVDLRHQMMDERKNADEWMIDYALQRAVMKLGPVRKRKVALLVEAFETVVPLPMCEKHLSHGISTFTHLRSMQACS